MTRRTAVIAEDEPVLRDALKDALATLWPELAVVAEADDGVLAMQAIEAAMPDVLFLDIAMPGLTGIEVARRVNGRCHVVFVTAFDEHAIAAFEQGALDYVLKPFTMERLGSTVARLKQRVALQPADLRNMLEELGAAHAPRQLLRWIKVAQGRDIKFITIDEICYFKADNKYTLVTTPDTEALITTPICDLLEELDPEVFWQIHRGTVVSVNAIASVHRAMNGSFEVRLKKRTERLAVSAPYAHRFR